MRKIFAALIGIAFALVACIINAENRQPITAGKNNNEILASNTTTESAKPNTQPNSPDKTEICESFMIRQEYENCLENEFNKLDTKLSEVYKTSLERLKKDFSEKDINNLKSTQKKWLDYRESEWQAEKDLYGEGTDAVGVGFKCLIDLTDKRTAEILLIYGKNKYLGGARNLARPQDCERNLKNLRIQIT